MLNKKLTLDKAKIQFFYNTYNITGLEKQYVEEEKRNIEKYINMGDLQPAFVYSLEPLIIACFTDEFDDVILLQYPKEYIEKYNLKENDKLVTSNVYWEKRKAPYNDIVPGVFGSKRFKDIYPMVLKFLVTEEDKLEEYINEFSNYIWEFLKNKTYGRVILSQLPPRDGMFYLFQGGKR